MAKSGNESAFKDVSKQAEQAQEDAAQPLELDDEGRVTNLTSKAASEVAEEQAKRAGAQANGGGPWPEDLMLQRFVGSTRIKRPEQQYTSHEG